ncbi:unnamed protein product, partial [Brachionus calyciflorus]
ELSIESISNCVESNSKRSKPEQDDIIIQSEVKKEKSVFILVEFWLHDERLDQSIYYNIVEDEGLDIGLFVWCQMEVILDLFERNSICYTVEHYYHMLNNKNKFMILQKEYNALFDEYRKKYENKNKLIQKREDFVLQRENFRQKIKKIEDKANEANKEMKRLAVLLKSIYS